MGLFDSYYDASQPSGGGLLERLLASLQTPTQGGALASAFGSMGVDPASLPPQQPSIAPTSPAIPPGIAPPISTSNYTPPAAPAFGAGGSPFLYAGYAGPGSMSALPRSPMDANAAAQPQNPPIPVGNYQMPRIGGGFQQDIEPEEPVAAQPGDKVLPRQTAQERAAGQLPAQFQSPDTFGSHLMAGAQNFTHGGSILGAILNGITGLATGERTDPLGVQQRNQQQTYQALVAAGIPPQKAMLAAIDPKAHDTIVAEAFGKDKFSIQKTGQNGLGQERYEVFNPATGEHRPLAPASGDESGGLGDMNLTGQAYLASVPVQQRGTLKGMLDGTIQPPSSFAASKPYWQTLIASAKHADPTWDENSWAGRHKMSIELASSGNSSMGGILSNGESAFKHLADYTASVVDQGNVSHNFPLGGYIAHAQNAMGNSMGGSNTLAKVTAINDNLGHYGQESTKFYAGTGGGVEERVNARKEMNATTTSGEEAAAYAEKEKGLMLDRLGQKFNQIRDIYGEEAGNRIIAKHMPDIQANIAKIDANIAKLRGENTATPGGTAKTGVKWSIE
jgi:hypothetical protein